MSEPEDKDKILKRISGDDQSLAYLSDLVPRMWRGLYVGMLREGFTEDQALILLRTYIARKVD